jgi:hypothetical protein
MVLSTSARAGSRQWIYTPHQGDLVITPRTDGGIDHAGVNLPHQRRSPPARRTRENLLRSAAGDARP